MRRLLCAVLVILMTLPVLAAAKTVLYVTASPSCWHAPCSCLPDEESPFCERMIALGYNVTITSEGHVISNSPQWQSDWNKADMIFLGDTSSNASGSSSQQFCDVGLGSAVSQGRKLFATFGAARKSGDLVGCALRGNTMIVGAPDPNGCDSTLVTVTQSGYMTTGWPVDSTFQAYNSTASMAVSDGSGWVAASCTIGGVTKLWPVLATGTRGTFWGLDTPSNFASDTWTLFDWAVIYTMGDNVWTVNAFTVPELPTAGQPVWVAAHVFDRGNEVSTGTVSQFLSGRPAGKLGWYSSAGAWLNRSLILPVGTTLAVGGDQGTATLTTRAGNVSVNIMSGNYQAGKYQIRAEVKSGASPATGTVSYRIRAANLTVIASGEMEAAGGVYQSDVTLGSWGDLVLEVNARTSADTGGSVKTITSAKALKQGTDWLIDPAELQLSATLAGSESVTFTLSAITSGITGLHVSGAGQLAGSIIVDAGIPTSVDSGDSISFNVKMDRKDLAKGQYTGSLLVQSDQFSAEVPIKLAYLSIPGNWISVQPQQWTVIIPAGKKATQTFSVSSKALYASSAISVSPSAGMAVSVKKKPWWIPAGGAGSVELEVDASGMVEGTKKGTVTITSSLGSAELPVTITVTKDLSGEKDRIAAAFAEAQTSLSQITWTDTAELQAKAAAISTNLSQFDAAWDAGDWTAAKSALDSADGDLSDLQAAIEKIGQPFPWDLVLIAAGIAGAGVAAFFGYRWWMKRHKKAEAKKEEEEKEIEEEMPKAEDRYRTEWY